MLPELLAAVVVTCVCLYLFAYYIVWSKEYANAALTDPVKKASSQYSMIAPPALIDSYKVVKYQVIYQAASLGLDLSNTLP